MLLWILSACCGDIPVPTLNTPRDIQADKNETITILIDDVIVDTTNDHAQLDIIVTTQATQITSERTDSEIILQPDEDWAGSSEVTVEIVDKCDTKNNVSFNVQFGDATEAPNSCATTFSYTPQGSAESVSLAGSFNDWTLQEMEQNDDGAFVLNLELEAGSYTYKFVESTLTGGIAQDNWVCDPNGDFFQYNPYW